MEKNPLCSNCMQHEMSQSLLVFAVSFTPEAPNFGTFYRVAHPPLKNFFNFCFLSVYMHIFKI